MENKCSTETTKYSGFSLVEVLLAVALFAIVATGFIGSVIYIRDSAIQADRKQRATMLAEEALEISRDIRNRDFNALSNGSFAISQTGNLYNFIAGQDQIDIFTRNTTVSTVDTDTKKVISTVNWQSRIGDTQAVTLETYLTNWRDVTNPVELSWALPIVESTFDLSGNDNTVALDVVGPRLYVNRSGGNSNFPIIDITIPANLTLVSEVDSSDTGTDIIVLNNNAYLTSSTTDLTTFNILNENSPTSVDTYNAPGSASTTSIFENGGYLFTTRASSSSPEFEIFDTTNPASPTKLGTLEIGDTANDSVVVGNTAYLASNHNSRELQVINVTNKSAPVYVTSINLPGNTNANRVDVFGNVLVISRTNGQMFIYDITTPLNPVEVGTYNTNSAIYDIDLHEELLFISIQQTQRGLTILDLTDPSSPSLLSELSLPDRGADVEYDPIGNRVYIASRSNNQEIFVIAPQ